jgi:NADH-quinone oxidoreductase subunit N
VTALAPFIPSNADLRPFAAEMWLVGGIAANLMVPFVTRRPNLFCAIATLATLVIAIVSLLWMGHDWTAGLHLRGMLMFDSTALVWKLTLLCFVAGLVLLWIDQAGRTLREGDGPEFFVLLLGATLGMCLMASTTNLLMIFMAVAMASLPSYLLSGFSKNSKRGSEASLKYVLFGAVTGAILIYGISFIYGIYGTLQLTELADRAPVAGASAALTLGVIGLLIGIGFKISAVPLHLWCPDVFEGSTIEVTTFLSVASKGAALVLLLRIVQLMGLTHWGVQLGWVVGVMGAVTATVGNSAAFTQNNIKRLLAYSSIAQAGYMMCLIAAAGTTAAGTTLAGATAAGTGVEPTAITQALLIYLMIYAVMNLGAFAVTAVVVRQGGEQLHAFAGLGRSSPLLAGSMLCCLVSLIGLPPLAGFGAKVNILWVLVQQGGLGKFLVVVVVLNTILSAFYYFRVVRLMYLRPVDADRTTRRVWASNPIGAVLGLGCATALILMFFLFGRLFTITEMPETTGMTSETPAASPVTVAVRPALAKPGLAKPAARTPVLILPRDS